MLGVMSMVNAWHTIYANLPFPIRSLITISIVALFLVVLFQTINKIRT